MKKAVILSLTFQLLLVPAMFLAARPDDELYWQKICIQTLGEEKGNDLFLQIADAIRKDNVAVFLRIIDAQSTSTLLKMGNAIFNIHYKTGLGGEPELLAETTILLSIVKRLDSDRTSEACLDALKDSTLHPKWRALLAYNLLFDPYESVINENGIRIKKYGINSLSLENKQKWLHVLQKLQEENTEDSQLLKSVTTSIEKLQESLRYSK